jgi:hypothetical protein
MATPPSKKTEEVPAPVQTVSKPAPVALENPEMDPALVAVIAAAIAAAEEKPVEGFVVRSIRRVKTNKWR